MFYRRAALLTTRRVRLRRELLAKRGVRFEHLLRGILEDFAVVRHEAVDFDFNVRRLRVDRRRKTLFDQRTKARVQFVVTIEERVFVFKADVTPVAVFLPRVSLDGKA